MNFSSLNGEWVKLCHIETGGIEKEVEEVEAGGRNGEVEEEEVGENWEA